MVSPFGGQQEVIGDQEIFPESIVVPLSETSEASLVFKEFFEISEVDVTLVPLTAIVFILLFVTG